MGQIQKGHTYGASSPDNQVTYSNLNDHVDAAILLKGAISEQTDIGGATASDDYLLIYDASANSGAGGLRKVALSGLLYALQVATANLAANILSADATGRGKMADAFLVPSKTPTTDTSLGTSGSVTIDWSTNFTWAVTLTNNITVDFSNARDGQQILLAVTQAAAGSKTVSWTPTIRWRGGSAPVLTTTANKTDLFAIVKIGSAYFGNWLANF